jgi:hypothetical protein
MPALANKTPFRSPPGSPFDLENEVAYQCWRDAKLADYPGRIEDLMVEVNDPRSLTEAERDAILCRIRKTNMALYQSAVGEADKDILRRVGWQFGLRNLDRNWLADEDGITQVTVSTAAGRQSYIPYTNRPIKWHTDGYYNPPARRIWAMLLHCVHDARAGGGNALLDHEIVYLQMRDANPEFVRALMAEDAMTIPARTDENGIARPAESGPVFFVARRTGALHMRYTARTRSVEWKSDPATRAAVAFLEDLLGNDSRYVFRARLAPGAGIVSNNVLHDREGFEDDATRRRLLYRARYHDRIGDATPPGVAR